MIHLILWYAREEVGRERERRERERERERERPDTLYMLTNTLTSILCISVELCTLDVVLLSMPVIQHISSHVAIHSTLC